MRQKVPRGQGDLSKAEAEIFTAVLWGAGDVGMGICDFEVIALSRVVESGGTSPRTLCCFLTYG